MRKRITIECHELMAYAIADAVRYSSTIVDILQNEYGLTDNQTLAIDADCDFYIEDIWE